MDAFEIGRLARLELGYVGETGSREIRIDMTEWLQRWPGAAVAVDVLKPDREEYYLAPTDVEDGILCWVVTDSDVDQAGRGMAQIRMYDFETGKVYKSRTVETIIRASIDMAEDVSAPHPMDTWVARAVEAKEGAIAARDEAVAANESATAARDEAVEAAGTATAAAEAAEESGSAAATAAGTAQDAATAAATAGSAATAAAEAAEESSSTAEAAAGTAQAAAGIAQEMAKDAAEASSAAAEAAEELQNASATIDSVSAMRGIPVTDWEQGVIASATGANGTSTTRCRSGYHRVLAGAEVRVAANGQQYIVYTYDSDQGYIGRTSDGWVTEDTAIVVDWDGYIRLCVAYTDSATITPDEVTVAVDLIPVIVSEFEKIHDAFTSSPTAIVCEAAGDVAVTTDAAERQAQSLVSIITAVQEGEGDPTPDNVRPIVGWDAVQLWHGAAYDAAAEATLSADLPEIVYGGTLDWATGLLTITHFVQTLDGTETWASTTAGVYSHSSGSLYAKTASTNQVAYHVCSHFKADRYRSSGNADNSCYETNNNKLNIKCTSITTLADWTAYLAAQAAAGTPVTIVWEYIPKYYTTIQLDSQALTLLKGSNALWSDTGDTSVVYIADTKMYIDNAIAAIAASIINQ